jgi:hypothetical protein
MKKIAALSATMALALLALGAHAAPVTNFLFMSSGDGPQPLGAVRDGVFAPVQADAANSARPQLRYRFGANGKEERLPLRGLKLFGYRDGNLRGTWNVRGATIAPMDGAVLLDIPDYDTKTASLLASAPLRSAGPAPSATPADVQAARAMVQALLAKRGIPRKAWPPVMAELKAQAVRIVANAAPVLVISGSGEVPWGQPKPQPDKGERVFSYLLIAETSGGRWTPAFQKTFYGDGMCAATNWSYLDHADLDADGTDELIIDAAAFETSPSGTILRRTAKGGWKTTAAGELEDGSGC